MAANPQEQEPMQAVHDLVDMYRTRCLWYLREDYYPETLEAALRALDAISRHGDLEAFQKAAAVRQCLLHPSSSNSAV